MDPKGKKIYLRCTCTYMGGNKILSEFRGTGEFTTYDDDPIMLEVKTDGSTYGHYGKGNPTRYMSLKKLIEDGYKFDRAPISLIASLLVHVHCKGIKMYSQGQATIVPIVDLSAYDLQEVITYILNNVAYRSYESAHATAISDLNDALEGRSWYARYIDYVPEYIHWFDKDKKLRYCTRERFETFHKKSSAEIMLNDADILNLYVINNVYYDEYTDEMKTRILLERISL